MSSILRRDEDTHLMVSPLVVRAARRDDRTLIMTASTETVDRMGDIVRQDGIHLDRYRKNPVILWGHDHSLPPIAVAEDTRVVNGRLTQVWRFPESYGAVNNLSETVYQGYVSGVLRASSIGFMPMVVLNPRSKEERDKLGLGDGGVYFDQSELYEVSAVSVPANPDALVQMRSMGIDTTAIEAVLARGHIVLPEDVIVFLDEAQTDEPLTIIE